MLIKVNLDYALKKHEVTQFAAYTQGPLCTSPLKPPSDIATFAVAFVVFAVLVAVASNFMHACRQMRTLRKYRFGKIMKLSQYFE